MRRNEFEMGGGCSYAKWVEYVRQVAPSEPLPANWIAPRRLEEQTIGSRERRKPAMTFGELQSMIDSDPWGALDKAKRVVRTPEVLAEEARRRGRPGAIGAPLDPAAIASLQEDARRAAERWGIVKSEAGVRDAAPVRVGSDDFNDF